MQLTRRVFSAIALTAALALSACGSESDPAGEGQSAYERGSDRGVGSATAALTMTEYASVACGHCAAFHEEVWPMLHDDYIETGKIRFVFREMITGSPQFAIAGFALAHCVAPERYFDMIDLLFQQQRAIFQAAGEPGGARGQYLAIARSMGMSEADFTACLDNQEINADIVAAHERALADGIDSTPRFLFNGELLEARRAPGATDYTYFIGNSQVMIDGEPVLGMVDAATFRRLIDHLLARLDADTATDTGTEAATEQD
tara:strand:+ start:2380 stop:3159 length:780 start_codon:yes stop_codon:yes gene_type:complete